MAATPTPQPNPAEEPTPAPAPTDEQRPAGEDVRVKRSFRERVSARPFVTTGVAALVAFCVAGVGGFALGHAAADDGPRDSIARFDDGGMRGENGPGHGHRHGFGDGSEQGPGGDRSEQGPHGDRSEQDSTERPGQGSTERPDKDSTESPDGDAPATPEQEGAAAQL